MQECGLPQGAYSPDGPWVAWGSWPWVWSRWILRRIQCLHRGGRGSLGPGGHAGKSLMEVTPASRASDLRVGWGWVGSLIPSREMW